MNGAEDMIVDHNMVVTQVFRRLGKRLDRPRIAAEFDLRINHTSFQVRIAAISGPTPKIVIIRFRL